MAKSRGGEKIGAALPLAIPGVTQDRLFTPILLAFHGFFLLSWPFGAILGSWASYKHSEKL
jgi:hypothetical protein